MSASPPTTPLSDTEIVEQERGRFFGHVVAVRTTLIPVFAGALLALAVFEPVPWRVGLLVTLAVVVPAFFVVEHVRYRRHGFLPITAPLNLTAAALGQLLVCAATGGILSPFISGVVVIAGFVGGLLPSRRVALLTGAQIASLWGFAAIAATGDTALLGLSTLVASSPIELALPSTYYYTVAAVMTLIVTGASLAGRSATRVFSEALRRIQKGRSDLLAAHDDQVRALTALSAEIAHELKNPLASVKGLAALLAQNPGDPRSAERLAVLRGEVDRMQSILEEFLNFSRPLVPLAVVRSSASELCSEVAALHEGLAKARGVGLYADTVSDDVILHCDPRKVKQILINLVQNALEASEPGSTVTLESEPAKGGAVLRVLDEGRGLAPELGDVFAPGVSSRSGGAGIGLTIARALAEQHGGTLSLVARVPKGCVAELVLPARPAAEVRGA